MEEVESSFNICPTTNLLVIEDIPEIRELLIEDLRKINFEGKVFQASNLNEAIGHAKKVDINFIFLDQSLPDGEGLSFAKKLRKHNRFKNVPILMISANDLIDDVLHAIGNGIDNYLIKPWKPKELREAMQYAFDKATGRDGESS